jgi:Raf kinase inhibitor-like YbhB/YbcL family protein
MRATARQRIGLGALCGAALLAVGCTPKANGDKGEQGPVTSTPATIALSSPAFTAGGAIPPVHTCEGKDASPALTWSGLPETTKSLALVVDDPDAPDPAAPKTTWVHWVLYNLPPATQGLGEAIAALPSGTGQGLNDWKRTGFGGPCPPVGRHRYVHKLYALDVVLPDLGTPTKAELEKAMQGHVVGKGELIGTYQKSGKAE